MTANFCRGVPARLPEVFRKPGKTELLVWARLLLDFRRRAAIVLPGAR